MKLKQEAKIILLYLVISLNWIIFSDRILSLLIEEQLLINQLQTYKGIFYVITTAIIFYFILKKTMPTLRNQKEELQSSNEQLEANNKELQALNEEIEEYHKIQQTFQKDLIYSITNILEMYDTYTDSHSQRVAHLSKNIAEKMNLSSEEIKNCYWAGLVHDIGKILIPKSILNKPGPLTVSEFEKIKQHPVMGYETLSHSKKLKNIPKYVLYHHEHWDGNGYPENLKEDEIPLISQIICLADSWHAMCSARPYRKALPVDKALEEIKTNKSTQFSPAVVTAFLEITRNNSDDSSTGQHKKKTGAPPEWKNSPADREF